MKQRVLDHNILDPRNLRVVFDLIRHSSSYWQNVVTDSIVHNWVYLMGMHARIVAAISSQSNPQYGTGVYNGRANLRAVHMIQRGNWSTIGYVQT